MRLFLFFVIAWAGFGQTTVINGSGSTAVPTLASTGFPSTFTTAPGSPSHTATIANTAAGITLTQTDFSADNINTACKATPTAPYTISGKFITDQAFGLFAASSASNTFDSGGGFAYRDSGTGKIVTFFSGLAAGTAESSGSSPAWSWKPPSFYVIDWSDATTAAAGEANAIVLSPILYEQLKDDNAGHIQVNFSFDGAAYIPLLTITKASGYLGATGYNQVCLFVSAHGSNTAISLAAYSQTSP
jgi:predicted alpha/beta hydrolase